MGNSINFKARNMSHVHDGVVLYTQHARTQNLAKYAKNKGPARHSREALLHAEEELRKAKHAKEEREKLLEEQGEFPYVEFLYFYVVFTCTYAPALPHVHKLAYNTYKQYIHVYIYIYIQRSNTCMRIVCLCFCKQMLI
jgi:hypothetical protein